MAVHLQAGSLSYFVLRGSCRAFESSGFCTPVAGCQLADCVVHMQSTYSSDIPASTSGHACVSQVRSSQNLRLAAAAAIVAGNAVNVGTPYGDAKAVRLDSLLKLADLKVSCLPQLHTPAFNRLGQRLCGTP